MVSPSFCRFTEDAAERYRNSPWSIDTPIDQVSMFRTDEGLAPEIPSDMALDRRSPGVASAPKRLRLFGRIMRGLDSLGAVRLHNGEEPHIQTRMLASAGAGVGSFWTAVPTDDSQRMTNAQWNRPQYGTEAAPGSLLQPSA